MKRLPFGVNRVLLAGVLALLGALTWWWLRAQSGAPPVADQRHPDSYFIGLDVLSHDAAGRPEMRVEADYAEHFEDEPWIHLRELRAASQSPDAPPWRLAADNGRMNDDGSLLEVHGNVVLNRDDDTPLELHTTALTVNADTRIAVTDKPVTIIQGAARISGRGLWVSLADDRLRLEHDVEAHYAE